MSFADGTFPFAASHVAITTLLADMQTLPLPLLTFATQHGPYLCKIDQRGIGTLSFVRASDKVVMIMQPISNLHAKRLSELGKWYSPIESYWDPSHSGRSRQLERLVTIKNILLVNKMVLFLSGSWCGIQANSVIMSLVERVDSDGQHRHSKLMKCGSTAENCEFAIMWQVEIIQWCREQIGHKILNRTNLLPFILLRKNRYEFHDSWLEKYTMCA